jgi:hypothetical protein
MSIYLEDLNFPRILKLSKDIILIIRFLYQILSIVSLDFLLKKISSISNFPSSLYAQLPIVLSCLKKLNNCHIFMFGPKHATLSPSKNSNKLLGKGCGEMNGNGEMNGERMALAFGNCLSTWYLKREKNTPQPHKAMASRQQMANPRKKRASSQSADPRKGEGGLVLIFVPSSLLWSGVTNK